MKYERISMKIEPSDWEFVQSLSRLK